MSKTQICLTLTLLFPLFFLNSCRSFTHTESPLYNPENHNSLEFGICQAGAQWPSENLHFKGAPGAYERYLWSPYLKSQGRQELFDELGIKWMRSDFSWRRMEPLQGVWNFQVYDWLVDAAAENNRKVLALLVYDAPWIYDDRKTSRNITEKEREHYLNYVRTVARRYRDRIGGFEIWNEPNFPRFWRGSDEDFFALTREAVKVLKEEAPDVPVAVGALSYHPLMGGKAFLKKMIAAGALDGADAVSLHPYAISLEAAARRVADVKALLKENGFDHKVWITEMGFPTTGLYPHKVTLENHYAHTVKALTLMTAAGSDLITWYKIYDSYNPEEAGLIVPSERSFGFMSRKEEWKPGASAYALMATELAGLKYNPRRLELRGLQKSLVRSFLYEDEKGKTVLVLWSKDPEKSFSISIKGMEQYRIYSENTMEWETEGSRWSLGYSPVVVIGKSREHITLEMELTTH